MYFNTIFFNNNYHRSLITRSFLYEQFNSISHDPKLLKNYFNIYYIDNYSSLIYISSNSALDPIYMNYLSYFSQSLRGSIEIKFPIF